MFLESLLPQLPSSTTELLIYIVAFLGVILMIYSQFIEAENRRDLVRAIASAGLLVYSIYISNLIFIILSAGVFIACVVEFIEIYLGYHKHTPHEIKEYIKAYKKKR